LGQEFFINSEQLQNKISSLLPSQGGGGAGFDLSASTQIIPIVDLTESAEGSDVRADIQTALSFKTTSSFSVRNTTTTIVNNTGYFRIFGCMSSVAPTGNPINISITDGATSKILLNGNVSSIFTSVGTTQNISFDFIVFVSAGDSITCTSGGTGDSVAGCTRQIADIDGNLTNP
jgi:hypothetical protein|tara:strand:+ start:1186 stop:1710 length:525 start_codon:yes stop_codon:yes gene_type:complete